MKSPNLLDFCALTDSVLAEHESVKKQVEHLLAKYDLARNNDFFLIIMYLRIYEKIPIPTIPMADIIRLSGRLDAVRRARQHIQNDPFNPRFQPTEQTLAHRAMKRKASRLVHSPKLVEEKMTVSGCLG